MATLKTECQGYYKLEVRRPDGSIRTQTDWFPNIITDIGLNRMGQGEWYNRCQVGTGSTAPSESDTNLVALLATTTTVQSSTDSGVSGQYSFSRRTYRFGQGVAAGNIAEVGVAWGNSNAIYSRQLILDESLIPTTITVLSDEFLDVTYEIRVYIPQDDFISALTINDVEYAVTTRASLAGTFGGSSTALGWSQRASAIVCCASGDCIVYNGSIGAITGSPSGASGTIGDESGVYTQNSYVNNSLERTTTVAIPLGSGNIAGGLITAIRINGSRWGAFQFGISPGIPKDNTRTLTLTFKVSWGRRAS